MAKPKYNKNEILVTITEKHLDKAIPYQTESKNPCHCVVAEAISDKISSRLLLMGFSSCTSANGTRYTFSNELWDMIEKFDDGEYDEVRDMLPKTFILSNKILV